MKSLQQGLPLPMINTSSCCQGDPIQFPKGEPYIYGSVLPLNIIGILYPCMASTASGVQYIMLADDDADDRLLFEEALGELDVRVGLSMVKDGSELMHYLTGGGLMLPQILFLDLNMPFKNGFQCLDEIRRIKSLQDLFIIIYSTTARAGDIEAGYDKGANLFIQKPNSYTDLKKVLRTILTSQNLAFHPPKDQFVFRIS